MSFSSLQIRYQTARSLPAPYAYFFTLSIQAIKQEALAIDLAITYPDRDDIDDDELIAEGYTRDDDFAWKGQLPKNWFDTLQALVSQTKLKPFDEELLEEDDDFWNIRSERAGKGVSEGAPANADDWHYLMQELIQAAYEQIGRERPFALTYLDLSKPQKEVELQLTASFASRSVTLLSIQDRREQTRSLPWTTLQQLMSKVYEHDFDPEEAQTKRPKREGRWLNLGTEEWYDVSELNALAKVFRTL